MGSEIKRWQRSVVRDADTEASTSKQNGFASRLSKAACELFHIFLDDGRLETLEPHRRELSRMYGHLQLWCDGYGVLSGDLDASLSESKRLRHDTYRLLVSICHILADKMTTAVSADLDDGWQHGMYKEVARTRDLIEEATFANGSYDSHDSESDSGSDASSITSDFNIDEIIKDLETDIRCLVDSGPRYKEPIRDRTVEEQPALPSLAANWDPVEPLASRIRHRYPDGDPALAHVLGKMNWERVKRLSAARDANARAVERPAMKVAAVSGAKGTVVASDFHDSGLGTTLASPTSYTETVLSYRGTKGGSINVPQIPPEGMKGEPFICGICGCTCQLPEANWKSSWKRHVFSDLEPYVCVMAECKFCHVPFPHKNTWIQHLKLEHGFPSASKQISCPLCREQIGIGGIAHLARHLEEVSLTILPTNTESDDESDGDPEEASRDQPNISYGTMAKFPVDSTSPEPRSRVSGMGKPGEQRLPAWSRAVALYDFKPARASELPLAKGQNLWILESAKRSPGATWIPALCDQGQRQGWVPCSYVRLTGSGSLAEGSGTTQATVEGPEPLRPSPTLEFHPPWGEDYQAGLPSAFPPLDSLGEPRANTGAGILSTQTPGAALEARVNGMSPTLMPPATLVGGQDSVPANIEFEFDGLWNSFMYHVPPFSYVPPNINSKLERAVADEPKTTDKASEGEAAFSPHSLDPPEKPKGGNDERPDNGDFVLFEGVRDNLVYFPPLVDNTEALRVSRELLEKEEAYGKGPRKGPIPPIPPPLFMCPEPGCEAKSTRINNMKRHRRKHRRKHQHDGETPSSGTTRPNATPPTEELRNQHHAETHIKPQTHMEAESGKVKPGAGTGTNLDAPGLESKSPFSWKQVPHMEGMNGEDSDTRELFRSYGIVKPKNKDIG